MWLKTWLIKLAVNQLDNLKPIIEERVRMAQAALASVPPKEFADSLVEDLENAILDKVGIPKEDR